MAYWSNLGCPQDGSTAGPVVILEASQPDRVWYCQKSLGPVAAAEMEKLAGDGHKMTLLHSRIRIESSLQATRATQLYRTLRHEIGHLVDYASKVPEYDESKGISLDRHLELADRFWKRPSQEREVFAPRYADGFRSKMFSLGLFPFPRIESWVADELRACDFIA